MNDPPRALHCDDRRCPFMLSFPFPPTTHTNTLPLPTTHTSHAPLGLHTHVSLRILLSACFRSFPVSINFWGSHFALSFKGTAQPWVLRTTAGVQTNPPLQIPAASSAMFPVRLLPSLAACMFQRCLHHCLHRPLQILMTKLRRTK